MLMWKLLNFSNLPRLVWIRFYIKSCRFILIKRFNGFPLLVPIVMAIFVNFFSHDKNL